MNALSKSFRIFNHTNEQVHDAEIASKADAALCRLLSFLMHKDSSEEDNGSANEPHAIQPDEIAYTCHIIEMIYRCSKEVMEESFQEVGREFLHKLTNILARQLQVVSTSSSGQSGIRAVTDLKSVRMCLSSITKILCHYARSKSATISMAQHPQLLSLIISLLRCPVEAVSFEAHFNTLWVLANMACCTENTRIIASHDGLLGILLQVANTTHNQNRDLSISPGQALRLRHTTFRCLLNLSWDPANKSMMTERDDLILAIRNAVLSFPEDGSESGDAYDAMLLQTRMFALGTMRNIAHTSPSHQLRLCTNQNGMVLNMLCDITQDGDFDSAVRDKAFAVMFNLVSNSTLNVMISHPRLLDILVGAASAGHTNVQASTTSFRALNALASSHGAPECLNKVRLAIEQVNRARITVPRDPVSG